MADDRDDLTQADKEEIMSWLKEKWAAQKKTCPICEQNKWIIGGHIVTPITLQGGGFNIGGTNYPQFQLTCGNCGYTHYFNAVVAKLKSLNKSEKEGGDSGDTS